MKSSSTSPVMIPGESPQWKGGAYPAFHMIHAAQDSVIGRQSLWRYDFDTREKCDAWLPLNNVTLSFVATDQSSDSHAQGVLRTKGTAFDPYLASPPIAPRTTDLISGPVYARIRMKTNDAKDLAIFWSETDKPGFSPNREASFNLVADNLWHDYYTELKVTSQLSQLRLDPVSKKEQCEIATIELFRLDLADIQILSCRTDSDALMVRLKNHSNEKRNGYIAITETGKTVQTPFELTPNEEREFPVALDQSKPVPFETMICTVTDSRKNTPVLKRRIYWYRPEARANWITLHCGDVDYQFTPEGSGARIVRNNKIVGAIYPLVSPERKESQIFFDRNNPRNLQTTLSDGLVELSEFQVGMITKQNEKSLEIPFSFREQPEGQQRSAVKTGTVRFMIQEGTLSFEMDSPYSVHGPVLRAFGNMKQAIFPGVEYLEEGEYSSSTADIDTMETLRYAPPLFWITNRYMALTTSFASFMLCYNDPNNRPVFASPNFLENRISEHRMNVFGKNCSGRIRITDPAPIEESVEWWVKKYPVPELPRRPRTANQQEELIMAGFTQSAIKTENGWRHAVVPNAPGNTFSPTYGSDFLSTIWEITGNLPQTPRIDYGGGHIRNASCYLIDNRAQELLNILNTQAKSIRKTIRPDGSIAYSGRFSQGHWSDSSSGHTANAGFILLTHWRLTGNQESLAAGIKCLEYINREKTPRGAQIWELSLHTPDIMASARCCLCNTYAYEATGKPEYLAAAKRWALTGLPFVYLHEFAIPGTKDPIVKYAGIAVFGATGWSNPNWMGMPVQWCGFDYVHALLSLAPHEKTLDWRKIAEGMIISGEWQQYPEGPSVGLLPDSFKIMEQTRNAPDINPSSFHYLRRLLEGKSTALNPVFNKRYHVMAPFQAKIDGDSLVIHGKSGTRYQVVINGSDIRTIESRGIDRIPLAAPAPAQTTNTN